MDVSDVETLCDGLYGISFKYEFHDGCPTLVKLQSVLDLLQKQAGLSDAEMIAVYARFAKLAMSKKALE